MEPPGGADRIHEDGGLLADALNLTGQAPGLDRGDGPGPDTVVSTLTPGAPESGLTRPAGDQGAELWVILWVSFLATGPAAADAE